MKANKHNKRTVSHSLAPNFISKLFKKTELGSISEDNSKISSSRRMINSEKQISEKLNRNNTLLIQTECLKQE